MSKRIVVVGGGFAGSIIAKSLQNEFKLTLIDTKDSFEFIPGILKIVQDKDYVEKISVKHSRYLENARLVIGKVNKVGKDFVMVDNQTIPFDILVLATGAHYNKIKGDEKGVFSAYHSSCIEESLNELNNAKDVLIVGGGLVGLELAGEIAESGRNLNIKLVQSHSSLIPRNNVKSSKIAEEFLKNKGVEIIYNTKIKERKGKYVISQDRRKFNADVVYVATGLIPSSDFLKRGIDSKGHVLVDNSLRVKLDSGVLRNIFAVGDLNSISEEKTAQNAEHQANLVVRNIRHLVNGEKLEEYSVRKTPMIISLGKWRGIFESGSFVFSGFIPAVMKLFVEKLELWKRNRFL